MERPLTERLKPGGEPLTIGDYERTGGYAALKKVLSTMEPRAVIDEVKSSNLRGRGGAGFPTGQKWSLVPAAGDGGRPRYLISNSDEMEPGAFKDRLLMEGNPHQLIEGMIISSYTIQADMAYIFLRWEYGRSGNRLGQAIREAYECGYLGRNIMGSPYSLELYVHKSAGRYICGEETALLNALEGKRPIPRAKPPFPQVSGLWGNPTIVNNVETLSNIPHIVRNGAAWFRGLSPSACGGTKLYGVSGRVARPGVWELPMGVTMRELIEGYGGGMKDGFALRGVIPGGASTDFLLPEHLDLAMDFDVLQKAGSRLGTGTMIILDDRTCPVGMVLNLERFFARESCGWCTPCREGIPWLVETLSAIEKGEGRAGDIGLLEEQAGLLGPGRTFCAFAPGAMEPLQSALKYFRADFERHIEEKGCPWKK
jgi:NADH-quinone oxidoreductase subunit F